MSNLSPFRRTYDSGVAPCVSPPRKRTTCTPLADLFFPELETGVDLQSRYASLFLETGASTGGLSERDQDAATRSALAGGSAVGSNGSDSGNGYTSAGEGDGRSSSHSRLVLLPDLHGDARQASCMPEDSNQWPTQPRVRCYVPEQSACYSSRA